MTSFKKYVMVSSCLMVSFIFFEIPSFSQTDFSEQTLTSDVLIEDEYQPGSGLPVGKIQSVWGEALVFHRDPAVGYRIQTGLPLYAGDIIRTGATAWIRCRLIDGSLIALAPDTTLTVLQSLCSSVRKTCVSQLFLKRGDARFKLNPPSDAGSYEFKVQTDSAAASAEEADFAVRAIAQTTGFVALEKSRLALASRAQPEEVTFLSDFQKTILSPKTVSPTVEVLSREETETILKVFYPVPPIALFADSSDDDTENLESQPASE